MIIKKALLTDPFLIPFSLLFYEKQEQVLPAPVLLFPFLLFSFKLPLFLCFPLLPGHSFTVRFQLLLLQFQGLLRFCARPGALHLFPHVSPHPLRIAGGFFLPGCHSRTKPQPAMIFQNKIVNLVILRLRPKRNLTYG